MILGCTEYDGIWDFLSYGDLAASKKERNIFFEALLWLEFGYQEVATYCVAVDRKSTYHLKNLQLDQFRKGIFGAVVGESRAKQMAESMLQTNRYQMQVDTARAFGALQDYRAKTGENRNTLLLSRNMPTK